MKILLSDYQFSKLMLAAMLRELNRNFLSHLGRIRKDVESLVRKLITESDTWGELRSKTELSVILGIPAAERESRTDAILDRVVKSIDVRFDKFRHSGNSIKGCLRIGIIQADYSDLLGLPAAEIVSKNGHRLNWLQWLILDGFRLLLSDWTIHVDLQRNNLGRSEGAVMIASRKGNTPARIPPEHAGTENSNFLTKAFTEHSSELRSNIKNILLNKLG